MNISISTTQWGDVRRVTSRERASRRTSVISRNLIMALMTVTLASLMVIQAVGPAAFDNRPVVDDAVERSVEVMSGEELLQAELSYSDISSDGGGSNAVPK
ncbi:MAG TPA: hypothetical protein G4O11_07515 [Anaerolineae bacterium]|nr:hypothetical protein [Anaerolineae bacterium]